ncbi:hypothetical protein GGS21DRAFT_248590 [Xylaria nigripes]|nr:hypothetical protein GGS21DRAFT_248590 [Xylaria nigripes]
MTSTAMPSAPVVPPRPARSRERDGTAPTVPARPAKRLNRPISPNPDRFAPSPLNESPFDPNAKRNSQSFLSVELEPATSLDMPGVGEEGQEYAALSSPAELSRTASPEHTRIVGDDLKLHAPKPTVPAASAKQRVAAVTRTDSDRAAAFGFGRPSSVEPPYSGAHSLKKKASTISQLSHHSELPADDEHGIPEIGQRVPMLYYAGDVQAPSPAPRATSVDSTKSGYHTRRTSSRLGFHDAPPGSYGLHGHGIESSDRLERAYYEKHPEIYQKEHYYNLHDRANDYSMSSENLNKIVRNTASRGVGLGTSEYHGTPSEQAAFQASDEYYSRISTPQPPSGDPIGEPVKLPLRTGSSALEGEKESDVIHVDEAEQNSGLAKHANDETRQDHGASNEGAWPILAADEVAKDPRSRPSSRPSSRPTSIYNSHSLDIQYTPLEDVEEYEPLFPEDDKGEQKPNIVAEKSKACKQRFPSQDVWEDAPNSVYSTAEVLTPEPADASPNPIDMPVRDIETPAHVFARKQEELAEKESATPDGFLNRKQRPEIRVEQQSQLAKDLLKRPGMPLRFPSQDIWEDTPDSLQFTTTVSHPQSADSSPVDEVAKSLVATKKPVVPVRLPKKQGSGDDVTSKPVVPNRPKPQVPARPAKIAAELKPSEGAVKQKPVVPARPVGSKIAALQAGFMSDLNNRLRLGPQAPKKEVPKAEEEVEEKNAPAPLVDARKGRARGPQRRAPTVNPNAGAGTENTVPPPTSNGRPALSFSTTRTLWMSDFTAEKVQPEEPEEPVVAEVKAEEVKHEETEEALKSKAEEVSEEQSFGRQSGENDQTEDRIAKDNVETDQIEERKVEGDHAEENKEEEHKIQEVKAEEDKSESETLETKTPSSSEAQDIDEETKTFLTSTAGESVMTETADKKHSGEETKKAEEETRDEATL